jgi:hypothetical protein
MNIRNLLFAALFVALVQPVSSFAQSFGEMLENLEERSQERYSQIDHYVRTLKATWLPMAPDGAPLDAQGKCTGMANCQVYKVEQLADGRMGLRLLSQLEVAELAGISPGSAAMEELGRGYLEGQVGLNQAMTGEEDPSGKMATVYRYFNSTGSARASAKGQIDVEQPWMDPFAMMGSGGMMMLDTSKAMAEAEESLRTGADTAQREANQKANLLRQLQPQGTEVFGGVQASLYTAPNLNTPMQEVDGQRGTWNAARVWLDPDRLVLLGHRLEGTIEAEGETREFYVQVTNSDFRNPPGCGDMLEPYRQTMEMGGMLDDEQMAQMEEARQQLEEFEQQMASMPADQRRMMETMMGGQMETIRNMANGGAMIHTLETEEILCNPDLKALFAVPGMQEGNLPTADNLLVRIQTDLVTLGYEPGNTNGVLDVMTQVAISQFEAEAGLPVTGEPSQALADALRAAVAGQ